MRRPSTQGTLLHLFLEKIQLQGLKKWREGAKELKEHGLAELLQIKVPVAKTQHQQFLWHWSLKTRKALTQGRSALVISASQVAEIQ